MWISHSSSDNRSLSRSGSWVILEWKLPENMVCILVENMSLESGDTNLDLDSATGVMWLWARYLTFLYLSSIICESCDSSTVVSWYLHGISSKALCGYPDWQIPKSLMWNSNTVSPPSPMVLQIQRAASLVVQLVKNLPAMQETLVRFLGPEDSLEKG